MRTRLTLGRSVLNALGFMIEASAALFLLSPPGLGAEFVDLTAEFNCTNQVQYGNSQFATTEWSHSVHCIVGTNSWLIQGNFSRNAESAFLFSGTNVTSRVVLTKDPRVGGSLLPRLLGPTSPSLARASNSLVGKKWTKVWSSNGFGVGEAGQVDLAWLAFCSGPYLAEKNRVLPLPNRDGYFPLEPSSDRRQVFKDGFGLPRSVEFIAANGLLLGQYRVLEETNFLGWTFPLRFEVRQSSGPGGEPSTGLFEGAELVIEGRLTSIGPGKRPEMPAGPLPNT